MLHIYLIKAPSHTSASKLKEEKWAMDGFVSIFVNMMLFYTQKPLRHTKKNRIRNVDSLNEMNILV